MKIAVAGTGYVGMSVATLLALTLIHISETTTPTDNAYAFGK